MTALVQSDTATGNKAILNYELGVTSCSRLCLRFGIEHFLIVMERELPEINFVIK